MASFKEIVEKRLGDMAVVLTFALDSKVSLLTALEKATLKLPGALASVKRSVLEAGFKDKDGALLPDAVIDEVFKRITSERSVLHLFALSSHSA